jgi:WD40 repeat protein
MDFRPIFSPDGKWVITTKPTTDKPILYDADDGKMVTDDFAGGCQVVGFSPDSKYIASLDSDNSNLKYWLPNGTEPKREVRLEGTTPGKEQLVFLGMSPDQGYFYAIDDTGLIHIWNADSGRLLRTVQGPLPPVRNAVLSAHATHLAVSISRENVARLYDCETGAERELAGHRDFVSGLAFSPDGSTLATGSIDGTIRLWDTTSGESIGSLPGHMQETTDVDFSPDGRTLASVCRNESIKLWHLPTMREVISINAPQAGLWLRFSPDGQKLAVETDTNTLSLLAAPPE